MKFQHLQVGQRFEYQGAVYVKSSPLVANHCETGVAKMIPRSAVLKPVDLPDGEKKPHARPGLDAGKVRQAMNNFERQCREALTDSGLDEARQRKLASRFATFHRQLLETLGLQEAD